MIIPPNVPAGLGQVKPERSYPLAATAPPRPRGTPPASPSPSAPDAGEHRQGEERQIHGAEHLGQAGGSDREPAPSGSPVPTRCDDACSSMLDAMLRAITYRRWDPTEPPPDRSEPAAAHVARTRHAIGLHGPRLGEPAVVPRHAFGLAMSPSRDVPARTLAL